MALYSYGVNKAEEGIYDPTDGSVSGWKEIEVYQDSINMDWPDPTETPHFKQGDPNPKLTVRKIQPKSLTFSIMDTSAASKKNWLGGTVTAVDGVDEWHEADPAVTSIIKALRFTCEDGSVITMVRSDTFSKLNFNPTEGNMNLIDVKASPTSTGFAGVSAFSWADPEVV